MISYDDKTAGVIKAKDKLVIDHIKEADDVVLKASFTIVSDINCSGKVTALFDLIVMGDLITNELDVKGRLVCLGNVVVSGEMVVNNDIWAGDIRANSIICHNRIFALDIDTNKMFTEGNVIIGRTLAIEEKAETTDNIICGETAFGAGRIVANTVITTEPIDLDDGEDAIESPYEYKPDAYQIQTGKIDDYYSFSAKNDYASYINELNKNATDWQKKKLSKYRSVLKQVDAAYPRGIKDIKDASLLIWIIEISNSVYFREWKEISKWTRAVYNHFLNLVLGYPEEEQESKQVQKFCKGAHVIHTKYGEGIVQDIQGTKDHLFATVEFTKEGTKKFPMQTVSKFFEILKTDAIADSTAIEKTIVFSVENYNEWLYAMMLINKHREYLGEEIYAILYDLLLSKIGLKAKYVEERFGMRGSIDVK